MKKLTTLLLFLTLLLPIITNAQVTTSKMNSKFFVNAKEFSKDISLYKSKKFLIEEILGGSANAVQFEIDPLAAANSGDLTSLVYKCEAKGKEGMIFGFYGNYWNDAGVVYQGYAFKDLPKANALYLLSSIDSKISEFKKYLFKDSDNNNIYFDIEDITILIYAGAYDVKIRVFWNGFDADWDITAFRRTKKRFEKKVD